MTEYLLTSESVTEGHPDKVCDQISDAILDEYLKKDSDSRVAVETMISNNLLVIAGEVTSKSKVNIEEIAKQVLKEIGYTDDNSGFNVDKCTIITNIDEQSKDISQGVNKERICAGDQGLVYGYAVDESSNYMPMGIELAHNLVKRLAFVRKENIVEGLYPDGKSQVNIEYSEDKKIKSVKSIVIAAQHHDYIDLNRLKKKIVDEVILKEIDKKYITDETKIYINATGNFSIGGPKADVGLTGRKIIVDTYGGAGKHGGGAFSGKDYSKADRCAAYMARYIAKNIVASGLARECEIQLAYVIGREEAQSMNINTFGTENIDLENLYLGVRQIFDTNINSIIEHLDLKRAIYRDTACYGHFGRNFSWERLDKVELLKKLI
ncbi:methionine adenosyltransferase [Peptoniphilus indolicus]|uniref:S-adenosylmethionine synthase n=2 Tax=Peptoniphilus indolicus TaxID=33030 RepID=G4D1V0_9FIRM|nr:methionine adenosyltransferase [Peptoniphilus indolicus]EGY80493.1 methionine adenosyltransferase [Peptoniphilus indolicus ATCC 29427]SUB75537.1 S-adenosylmethionine synthase [Peptoniphilus indolicus]